MDDPGLVVHIGPHQPPAKLSAQRPPGGDEVVQFGDLECGNLRPDPNFHMAGSLAGGPTTAAGVRPHIALSFDRHLRPAVRQPIRDPGHQRRDQTSDIQAAKPHAASPLRVHQIGPNVGLGKRAQWPKCWQARNADTAHMKREQAHPGRAIERVHPEPVRQQRLNHLRVVTPVDRGQVMPALQHHR